jgi:hypothetical protein
VQIGRPAVPVRVLQATLLPLDGTLSAAGGAAGRCAPMGALRGGVRWACSRG